MATGGRQGIRWQFFPAHAPQGSSLSRVAKKQHTCRRLSKGKHFVTKENYLVLKDSVACCKILSTRIRNYSDFFPPIYSEQARSARGCVRHVLKTGSSLHTKTFGNLKELKPCRRAFSITYKCPRLASFNKRWVAHCIFFFFTCAGKLWPLVWNTRLLYCKWLEFF